MKKNALLIFSVAILLMAGCAKDGDNPSTKITSEDKDLAGVNVAVGETTSPYLKLFVLNEGKMGTNNASLDFLRYSDGKYCRKAFSQMNPDIQLGLGDVGNDLGIRKNELWIVMNNSGLVEVVNAINEVHIATITVPSPRNIAFTDDYAYVTSYSGAVYGKNDIKGSVYKIDPGSMKVVDSVRVGYQPEGIAEYNGKLYVANGGGLHAGYDNRIFVLDPSNGDDTRTISVASNLKDVYADENGNIWASAIGDYSTVHSGLYRIDGTTNTLLARSSSLMDVRVSCMTMDGNGTIYTLGTDDEWNWSGTKTYCLYKAYPDGTAVKTAFPALSSLTTPYAICVNSVNGDIYVSDAADYLTPGKVFCFDKNLNMKWSATAGVDPGHMILYSTFYCD